MKRPFPFSLSDGKSAFPIRRQRTGGSRLDSSRNGFALVLVLCFVVLLTVVILAYLSHSLLGRQVSNSSTNQTRAALFARGACDTVIGDLKQEIVAGSTPSTITAEGVTSTYYTPLNATNAVPYGVGANIALPNLLKISTNLPFYPGGPSPATTDSTINPSLNGRSVSRARWNQPLLLPKATPSSTTDLTPNNAFTAPSWILVSRDGGNPGGSTVSATFGATGSTVNNASQTNGKFVIGRYAYAIYDEGGLLDANVAGCPSTATQIQSANKTGLAYADLTQIPGMTAAATDALVGWRNYASAQPGGAFPNFTFNSAATTNYFNAILGNTTGFLTTANTTLAPGGASDQKFASRQQLIDFFNNALGATSDAALQNSLQYFGTFSRDLNQPSFTPASGRPLISDTDSQGNSSAGNNSVGQDNNFNPPFLSIRVTNAFDRNAGTNPVQAQDMAVVGEPLVKKRFPLNRLAWITYKGPSATRGMNDVDMQSLQNDGITQAFLQQGTPENIQKYFGLTWNNTGWTYSHGIVGSSGQPIIGYLSLIRDAAREPDFFELLKAALTAGSLAKGATNPNGHLEEASDYNYDTTLDYQILQIGANIIDQSTTDGYPTAIQFNNGTLTEVRGVKNLPYFYRVRASTIISQLPSPAPSQTVIGLSGGASVGPDTWSSNASLSSTGCYAVLWQPEVWNPHDVNSSLGNPRPSSFRIIVDGAPLDATGNATSSYNTNRNRTESWIATTAPEAGEWYSDANIDTTRMPNGSYFISNPDNNTTWQGGNTALTFGDNGGKLFREPTLLTKPNIPVGSNLALGTGNIMTSLYTSNPELMTYWLGTGIKCLNDISQVGTPVSYLGFFYGMGPIRWAYSPSYPNAPYYVMTADLNENSTISSAGYTGDTFRVQYDNNGTWTTYDQKYVPNVSQGLFMEVLNSNTVNVSLNHAIGAIEWVGSIDPRTRRFGNPGPGGRQNIPPLSNYPYQTVPSSSTGPPTAATSSGSKVSFWVDEANEVLTSDRWGTSSGTGWWSEPQTECMADVGGWYPNPTTNWMGSGLAGASQLPASAMYYRPGLFSQNNPAAISDGLKWINQIDNPSPQYYSDPDGVVRRAMGAYVPTGASDPATTTTGLPMATTGGPSAVADQSQSRPIILNRPFRSVAELGYVFSDTPWRNLSMFTPESGAAALLDVFCIQPDDNSSPLVAGKVNLNTRQEPVLQAILAGAYADELNSVEASGSISPMTAAEATSVANVLIQRTSNMTTPGQGPLANLAELVGKYQSSINAPLGGIDGSQSYTGFSGDLTSLYGAGGAQVSPAKNNIERFREAALRPLASTGQVRVWNLLIDLVAQTGRYPQSATALSNFVVEGETRYWLHVAIDRQTGQVIDQQLEVVRQ